MAFMLGAFTGGLFSGASSMFDLIKARDEMRERHRFMDAADAKAAYDLEQTTAMKADSQNADKGTTASAAASALPGVASPAADTSTAGPVTDANDDVNTSAKAATVPVTREKLADGSPVNPAHEAKKVTGGDADTRAAVAADPTGTGVPAAIGTQDTQDAPPNYLPATKQADGSWKLGTPTTAIPIGANAPGTAAAPPPVGALPTLPPGYVFGNTIPRPDPNASYFGGSAVPGQYLNGALATQYPATNR